MTDSEPGTARRGFSRVAEQVSAAAQTAVDKVTPDSSRQERAERTPTGPQDTRQGGAAAGKPGAEAPAAQGPAPAGPGRRRGR